MRMAGGAGEIANFVLRHPAGSSALNQVHIHLADHLLIGRRGNGRCLHLAGDEGVGFVSELVGGEVVDGQTESGFERLRPMVKRLARQGVDKVNADMGNALAVELSDHFLRLSG